MGIIEQENVGKDATLFAVVAIGSTYSLLAKLGNREKKV
jgi:hypothetical protein